MSLFIASSLAAIALEILLPCLAILLIARRRPGGATGFRGAAAGAGLFFAAQVVEYLFMVAGVDSLWGRGISGWPLVRAAIGAGILAGLVEETIRFGAAPALFGRPGSPGRTGSPLWAAMAFGLGWGGMESALIAAQTISHLLEAMRAPGVMAVPVLPLLGAVERISAIVLHVGLATIAVRAGREFAARRPGRAAAFYVFAFLVHASIDAMVYRLTVPAIRAIENEVWDRGLTGIIAMECWFAAGAWSMAWIAWWLADAPAALPRPTSGATGSASLPS